MINKNITIKKYYPVDIGLRNARLNFRQQEPTHIMENIIYNHLRIFGYLVDVGGGKKNRVTEDYPIFLIKLA